MKRLKFCLFSIIFIGMILYANEVFASSAYLSSNTSSVNIGDEFSVSINVSNISAATLTTRVSVDTSKVQYVSGPDSSNFSNGRVIYSWTDSTGGENPITGGTIATFTFRAISSGNANFGITGEFFSSDEEAINVGYSGTSVNIIEPAPPTEEELPPVVEEPPVEDVPNFEEPSQDEPYTPQNNNEQAKKSSNANLKSMQLDVVGISPAFDKNITNYWITIPTTIDSIEVNAIAEDSNARVTVEGNDNLQDGKNNIYIKVISEDRTTTKTYTINVMKDDDDEGSNANLESLAIEGITLSPEFNQDILEYTAELKDEINTLKILAFPQNEKALVKTEGNENLKEGENIVKITVTSENGKNEKVYTVKVTKKTEKEFIENQENINNTTNNKTKEKKNIVLVISIAIIIIMIVVLISRKYIKTRKRY